MDHSPEIPSSQTSFLEKLKSLGYSSYDDYLRSGHWHTFKRTYRYSGKPCQCAVCGDRRYHLHHHTYSNLGCESVEDVTPLCEYHHSAVHNWLRIHCFGDIRNTSAAVKALLGTSRPPVVKHSAFLPSKQGRRDKKARKKQRSRQLDFYNAAILGKSAKTVAAKIGPAANHIVARVDELVANGDKKALGKIMGRLNVIMRTCLPQPKPGNQFSRRRGR